MRRFNGQVISLTQAEFDALGGRFEEGATYVVDQKVKQIGGSTVSAGGAVGGVAGLVNNARNSNTSVIQRAIAGAFAGTQRARVLVVGMSTEAGAGSMSATLYASNGRSKSWPMLLAQMLAARGMNANADYICGGGNKQAAALPAFDSRIAFTNAAEYLAAQNLGGPIFNLTAGTGQVVFTPANPFDQYTVLACNGPTNSPLTITGSAGGSGTLATNGTVNTIARGDGSVTAGSTSLTIAAGAGSGGFPFLIGTRNSAKPGLEIINAGWGGSTSQEWVGAVAPASGWKPTFAIDSLLDTSALNVSIIALDINDAFTSVPLATFVTNLTTLVTLLKSKGDVLGKVSHTCATSGGFSVTAEKQQQYWDAAAAVFAAADVPWVDMRAISTDNAADQTNGIARDGFHWTALGNARIAAVMRDTLMYFA